VSCLCLSGSCVLVRPWFVFLTVCSNQRSPSTTVSRTVGTLKMMLIFDIALEKFTLYIQRLFFSQHCGLAVRKSVFRTCSLACRVCYV
jgi:hypothetical protein